MNTLLTIGGFVVAWTVGIGASAFLLAPPIIIVFFAIPFTFEMKLKGVLKSTAPARHYTMSLIILLALFAAGTWAIFYFFPKYFGVYLVGVIWTLVRNLRKCGRTSTNIAEFFENNSEHVNRDAYTRYFDD